MVEPLRLIVTVNPSYHLSLGARRNLDHSGLDAVAAGANGTIRRTSRGCQRTRPLAR